MDNTKSCGTKRPAPEVKSSPAEPAGASKKLKLEETTLRANSLLEDIKEKAQEEEAEEETEGSEEADSEEADSEDEVGISDEAQVGLFLCTLRWYLAHRQTKARLDHIDSMVSGLTKAYLKSIMNSLAIYGGGTNRDMAAMIVESLRIEAQGGGDLVTEEKVCQGVYRECYGPGCGSDSEEDSEGEY